MRLALLALVVGCAPLARPEQWSAPDRGLWLASEMAIAGDCIVTNALLQSDPTFREGNRLLPVHPSPAYLAGACVLGGMAVAGIAERLGGVRPWFLAVVTLVELWVTGYNLNLVSVPLWGVR